MTIRDMLWCQGAGAVYDADEYRQMLQGLVDALGGPGVVGAGALTVSERGSGQNMSVDVAVGGGFIAGTSVTSQGYYWAFSDTVVNVVIAASSPTNPRIDTIVLRAHDNVVDSGGSNAATIEVVTGTAAASPVAPVLPVSCLALANVAVAANASIVANGNITDRRHKLPYSGTFQADVTVGGNLAMSGASGTVTTPLVRVTSTTDAALASTAHGLQIGATGGANVIADGNEIMARNNGAEAALFLNNDSTSGGAGVVSIGDAGIATTGVVTAMHTKHGSISAGGANGYFAHDSLFSTSAYAMAVNGAGDVFLNAGGSGGSVHFRKQNGSDVMTVDSAFGVAVITFPIGLPSSTGTDLIVTAGGQLNKKSSSRRYKTKIRTLTHELAERDPLTIVRAVRARAFQYKRSKVRRVGFIAEEIAELVPEAVNFDEQGRPESLDSNGLIAVLWQAVQTLERRLTTLEGVS